MVADHTHLRARVLVGLAVLVTACTRPRAVEHVGVAPVDAGARVGQAQAGAGATAASKRTGQWRVDNPRPTAATLTRFWASSPTDLYAVGDGVVLHGDGSGRWTIRAHGEQVAALSGIWGTSATDLYAVGDAGVLHSTDGGARWASIGPKSEDMSFGYASIWGSSADDIYVTGQRTIHSTDRGKTWKELTRATNAGRFGRVFGRSAKDVWLLGSEHSARPFSPALILHSSDAGKTWQTQRRDKDMTSGFAAFFANDKVALAAPAEAEDTLLRSTNGGRSWQSVKVTGLGDDTPTAITGSGADLYSATTSGKVLKSINAGTSWTLAAGETGLTRRQIGQDAMIEDLAVVGDSIYAVGFGGVILRSRASGPWVVEAGSLFNKDLKAVWGTSGRNVYAVGDDGMIMHSTDEGATWRDASPRRKTGTDKSTRYAGIWGSGPSDIYVVGDTEMSNALVLHSSDGATFTEQAMPPGSSELVAVWGSDAAHVCAAGLHEISCTTDNGATWRPMWSNPAARLTGLSGGGGSMWATGWRDKATTGKLRALLLESTDQGASWREVSSTLSEHLKAVWRTRRGALLGVGYGPKIHRSVDRGATWSEEPIAFDGYMETLGSANGSGDEAEEIFAAGFNGVLFRSTHDGTQWEKIETGLDWKLALHAVWTSPEGDVFVVGDAGIILHRH